MQPVQFPPWQQPGCAAFSVEGGIVYEFLDYKTQDARTGEPLTIAPDAPLREAGEIFEQHNFNALPVGAPGGKVIGLLSKLDILPTFCFM
jgi:CBS domain-containing protein